MKKRITTIILTVLMLLQVFPQVSFAATDFKPVVWPIKKSDMVKALDIYGSNGNSHEAIDMPYGEDEKQEIYAIADGTVYKVSNLCFHYGKSHKKSGNDCGSGKLGNFITIEHKVNGKKYYSRYSHLTQNSMVVKEGDVVKANQHIANMGNSGNSQGSHLHFEIWEGDWDGNKTKRTLDYYLDNISIIKDLRFHKGLLKSKIYGNWIKEKYTTLKGNYYEYTGPIHIHNFKHDVANEKCYCGETFVRQYETINETYTVSTATSLNSKPYADYGERIAKLNKGDKVYVKRTFENVYGNVWCEAEVGNKKGYIYFGSLKGESSLKINLTSYPTSIKVGSSFGLRGEITSNYAIKKIVGYIQQGNTVIQSSNDTPNSKSVDVKNANLNKNLSFGKLSAGNYSLYVEVVDASGKVVSVNKNFNVYEEKKNDESTLKINLERYPVSINLGSTFSVRGNIVSNYSISKVKGYIYDANGSVVQSTTDTPNSKYMEIRPANLNQKLIFGKLSSGNYTMKVEAVDASGKVVTATKAFTVKGSGGTGGTTSVTPLSSSNTSIRFELESVPKGNLPYGKSFKLKGWFRSDSAIVEARAYMLDSNKNIVMQSDKASSTTSNYKIQGYKLDKAMKFSELKPGGYYLKFFVRDANGDTATWISDMFYIVK